MAIDCTGQALITDAQCLFPCIPPGMAKYVRLALLCAIANGTTMDCSAQNLVNQANCLMCQIPVGMVDAIEIYLLCAISNNASGGGGSGGVLKTTGNPEGVLTATNAASVAYDSATGAFYVYTGAAGGNTGWITVIAP